MSPGSIIVIAASGYRSEAHARIQQIQQAAHNLPSIALIDPEELSAEDLTRCSLVILFTDSLRTTGCYRQLLRMIEAAHAPVIALQKDALDTRDHLQYLNPEVVQTHCAPEFLTGFIRGVANREPRITALQGELNLAQRYHGGLEGQIARIHEELQLASMIQREYLPRELPRLHGVDFAAMWRPTNYVSGDIYDIRRLDEDHVSVFIADAVGHGVPAALLTMIIARSLVTKETFRSSYRIVEPGEVLARLNEQMIRCRGTTTRFVTAVYGIVNCRDRTVRMASAGHPPPIIIQPDGTLESIELEGSLLGVFDEETYQHREFVLPLHARLLLYSDGFEQAFPSDSDDGLDRIGTTQRYLDAFSDLAHIHDAGQIIQHIEQRLDSELGSLHQVDDLTLLCVHADAINAIPEQEADAQQPRLASSPKQRHHIVTE